MIFFISDKVYCKLSPKPKSPNPLYTRFIQLSHQTEPVPLATTKVSMDRSSFPMPKLFVLEQLLLFQLEPVFVAK